VAFFLTHPFCSTSSAASTAAFPYSYLSEENSYHPFRNLRRARRRARHPWS